MKIECLPSEVEGSLRSAGWSPERRNSKLVESLEAGFFRRSTFELSVAAKHILMELGGLRIDQNGPGREVAKRSFWFDPTAAFGEEDRFEGFARAIGSSLCPIGAAEDGEAFLAVAEDCRVLVVMDDGWIIGESIEEGLASLVLGKRGQPVFALVPSVVSEAPSGTDSGEEEA